MRDSESFFIDVGYRDPTDDNEPRPECVRPDADDLVLDPIPELDRQQLERELAFGNGIRQVLARDELQRRAEGGYQPPLFSPLTGRARS